MYLLNFFLCSVIVIIVYLNLYYSSVVFRNLTSEGVNYNLGPGPFAIRKVVQALHHQGDIIKYVRDSGGKQRMANAYFAIIFSSIKRVSFGKSFYLGFLLELGK